MNSIDSFEFIIAPFLRYAAEKAAQKADTAYRSHHNPVLDRDDRTTIESSRE